MENQLVVLQKYAGTNGMPHICIRKLPSGEGYEFCGCKRDGNGQIYWERIIVSDSEERGGIEYSAAGGLKNALPFANMDAPKNPGTLFIYAAGVISDGFDFLNAKKTGEEFLQEVRHRLSYFGRDSERLVKKIEEEPPENRVIMQTMLGNFTTACVDGILTASERFSPDIRNEIKEMLGYPREDVLERLYAEITSLKGPVF